MDYEIKPATLFMRRSSFTPMSRTEYERLSHPRGDVGRDASNVSTDISTQSGRKALLNTLTSRLGGSSGKSLLNSLVPSENAMGVSYGLYAGIGEVPAHKMRSLIEMYV